MTVALATPIRSAFRKVQDAVNGNTQTCLNAAVAEVEKLNQELQRMQSAFHEEHLNPANFKHDVESLAGRDERKFLFAYQRGYINPAEMVWQDFSKQNPQ